MSKYFVLTTAAVTDDHFTEAIETSGNERTNDDGTKTILEVLEFDDRDVSSAFNGETACDHDEIRAIITDTEWQ